MFVATLVFLFLIRLRFPIGKPLPEVIGNRYGRPALQTFRRAEKNHFRLRKLECDLQFLNLCENYGTIPSFIKFKVYNPKFTSSHRYRSWLFDLLNHEIKSQKKKLSRCIREYESALDSLKSCVSWFDFKCLSTLIGSNTDKKLIGVRNTHKRKLLNLGIDTSKKVNPNNVIFNLSSRNFTKDEMELLSLGMDFGLSGSRLKFEHFFLDFERLCTNIGHIENKYGDESLASIRNRISAVARNAYQKASRDRVNNPDRVRLEMLKKLKEDKNIIFAKPDKGRGIVILDRVDYVSKVMEILNDSSKFRLLNIDIGTQILKLEDKLNRFLSTIKDRIGETMYHHLYGSGSKPGVLHGLPKVHKVDNPIRPIISSIGTFNYNLAKYLVPFLAPFTMNEYTTRNSTEFVKEITSLKFKDPVVMASVDIKSLFTNVPLKETTDLLVDKIANSSTDFHLDRKEIRKALDLATADNVFTFNGQIYTQIDGVGMGSPLAPSYANAFLCHNEEIWLSECPTDIKPILYRRYVDDSFLIFNNVSQIEPFVAFLNSRHPSMKFTYEIEENSKLSFLDTIIHNNGDHFSSAVYRKETFTGLGLNFLSHCPKLYKLNSIKTLINRAYQICSNYTNFNEEINFLRNYFLQNGYPSQIFYKILRNFLNNVFTPSPPLHLAKKDIKYISLPYLGQLSFAIRKELNSILKDSYPHINFRFVFKNKFTIGSVLRNVETLPCLLRSCVVYEYTCSSCNVRYVGSTIRSLQHRVFEHQGRSYRGNHVFLSSPSYSAIREHCHSSDHPLCAKDFSILASAPNRSDLLTLESLFIMTRQPQLNNCSAIQLFTQ